MLQASGGAGALPEPTEAELEELYRSVDFHPEEQQAAAAAAPRAGAAGLHLTLDCLVTSASLLLLEAPPAGEGHGGLQELPKWQGAATSLLPQLLQPQSGSGSSSRASSESGLDSGEPAQGGGRGIATIELDRLKLSARMQPEKATATLTLADLALHDLCSEPGLSSPILWRGSADGMAAAAPSAPTAAAEGYLAPVLKLHFVAAAAGSGPRHAAAGEPGPEPRAQLDALVQPLLLRLRPLCIQRIVALVPAVAQVRGRRVGWCVCTGRKGGGGGGMGGCGGRQRTVANRSASWFLAARTKEVSASAHAHALTSVQCRACQPLPCRAASRAPGWRR